jgi:hypothetical protein
LDRPSIRLRIGVLALEVLGNSPDGLRRSELLQQIRRIAPGINERSMSRALCSLDKATSAHIYKPARGWFRLSKFRADAMQETVANVKRRHQILTLSKAEKLFGDWLIDELQIATHTFTPSSDKCWGPWGCPSIVALNSSHTFDYGNTGSLIVSAKIVVRMNGLESALAQACAARLFAHRIYLVVPKQVQTLEMLFLMRLCKALGLGLVVFDPYCHARPGFRQTVRAAEHKPDSIDVNQCIKSMNVELQHRSDLARLSHSRPV